MKKLTAILLVASTLVWIQPVLAQSDYGSDAETSTDSPAVPEMGESWDVGPSSSYADPALAPAPEEPMGTESAPMFGGLAPAPSRGPWMQRPEGPFAQPFVNPTFPATGMSELPPEGMPHGGFVRSIR